MVEAFSIAQSASASAFIDDGQILRPARVTRGDERSEGPQRSHRPFAETFASRAAAGCVLNSGQFRTSTPPGTRCCAGDSGGRTGITDDPIEMAPQLHELRR